MCIIVTSVTSITSQTSQTYIKLEVCNESTVCATDVSLGDKQERSAGRHKQPQRSRGDTHLLVAPGRAGRYQMKPDRGPTRLGTLHSSKRTGGCRSTIENLVCQPGAAGCRCIMSPPVHAQRNAASKQLLSCKLKTHSLTGMLLVPAYLLSPRRDR